MANTTITVQDGLKIKDQNNFTNHAEKTFNNFNVDLNKIKFDHLKSIKKDWYFPIFEETINLMSIKPINKSINKKEKTLICVFENKEDNYLFLKEFQKLMYQGINKFLVENDYNIKEYNRILVFEMKQEELTLSIRF